MIDIPKKFMVKTNHVNPPYNDMIFEEYFYRHNKDIKTIRNYLPIMWTNFYISRKYGQKDMSDLQLFLDSLDKNRKYFHSCLNLGNTNCFLSCLFNLPLYGG